MQRSQGVSYHPHKEMVLGFLDINEMHWAIEKTENETLTERKMCNGKRSIKSGRERSRREEDE